MMDQLYQFFTSTEGLRFIALFIIIDGLLSEIFGVFVLVAPDYQRFRAVLTSNFDFRRVEAIQGVREWINEEADGLRRDDSFDSEGQFRQLVYRGDDDKRFLEYILFPEEGDLTAITRCGFSALSDNPRSKDIVLNVDTGEHRGSIIDDDTFDRWYQQAITRSYYRQGAWLIVLGFVLMGFATVLQIVAFVV